MYVCLNVGIYILCMYLRIDVFIYLQVYTYVCLYVC